MEGERLISAERTCTKCSKSESCWAYNEMIEITNRWPVAGFVGAGAPGWKGDIFAAFANGCLLFEFNKLKNTPKPNV